MSVLAVHVQAGVLSAVGLAVLGVPGVVGGVASTTTVPPADQLETLPAVSTALALIYQVPSVRPVGFVKLVVALVPALTPVLKPLSCDHCKLYGVAAKASLSVLAVHVQVGVLSADGVVVLGTPGVVGVVVSIPTEPPADQPDWFPA